MPDQVDLGHAARLPPRDAIRYFTAKGYKVSWNWWEVWQEAHARAFTVAKAVKLDVLESIRGALDKAIREGRTGRQFAKEIEPQLRRLGWWGRQFVAGPDGVERVQLGSPWRLRTIFDTNMRTTYAAAREQAQLETADSRPYWMYSSRQDSRVRPAHAALDGAIFRADDPIWRTHYPPNGWNCRCRIRALTERQVRARGARVLDTRRGDGELREVMQKVGVDKRTGEEIERPGTAYSWTEGGQRHTLLPDAGWSYRPGRGGSGRLAVPPPEPRRARPVAGADARRDLAEATAAVERRRADRIRRRDELNREIGDFPTDATGLYAREALQREIHADEREIRAIALRRIQRDAPAAWAHGGEARWANEQLERRWGTELEAWRRMVRPSLVGRLPAPTIGAAGDLSSAAYWRREIAMEYESFHGTMVHEASHLLERDERTLRRAAGFLGRRTRGDAVTVIDARGDLGRRDRWRDPDGDPDYYVGRLYTYRDLPPHGAHSVRVEGAPGQPATVPVREGNTGAVDVYVTEVLSMGMQWLYQNPVGFARQDPEFFDFIWDTLIGGD